MSKVACCNEKELTHTVQTSAKANHLAPYQLVVAVMLVGTQYYYT